MTIWATLRLMPVTALAVACLSGCGGSATARDDAVGSGASPAISAMNGFSAMRLPAPQLARQLDAMRANGVQVVRADAAWATIEPRPPSHGGGAWQFAQTDAWVSALARNHLRWEPILDYAVGWAKRCPGFCPPSSNLTYAAFARAVAARYGEHGSFWSEHPALPYYPAQIFEIWNEENSRQFWSTGPDPARYARLYLDARAAVRSVDPRASVTVGGLAGSDAPFEAWRDVAAQFVERMFAAEPSLSGNVDGFALHPYAPTARDAVLWTVHFREVLDELGEGAAPIDVTEFGWTTGARPRETRRAWMMNTVALTLARSNCGIRLLAPYDWINPFIAHETADFGLVNRTGTDTSLRPAGTTWFHGLRLGAVGPGRLLCSPAGRPLQRIGGSNPPSLGLGALGGLRARVSRRVL